MHGLNIDLSPQSTQKAQSSDFISYETTATARLRTRMTRIARIFMDHCASLFHPPNNKPQRSQRTQSRIANLCALCVLCGGLTLFIAKNANTNSKAEYEC